MYINKYLNSDTLLSSQKLQLKHVIYGHIIQNIYILTDVSGAMAISQPHKLRNINVYELRNMKSILMVNGKSLN